jgi:hypothetical protein
MEQLKYDLELLKSAIDQFRRKNENLRALKTREELLLNHKFFPVRVRYLIYILLCKRTHVPLFYQNQETSIGIDPFSRESDLLDEAHRQMNFNFFFPFFNYCNYYKCARFIYNFYCSFKPLSIMLVNLHL